MQDQEFRKKFTNYEEEPDALVKREMFAISLR